MATKKKPVTPETSQAPVPTLFALADESIGMIREILQLTLYTGTNIIDHLRALRLEVDADGRLVPNEDYIVAYNEMVATFAAKAKEMAEEASRKAEREVEDAPLTLQ